MILLLKTTKELIAATLFVRLLQSRVSPDGHKGAGKKGRMK